METVVQGQAELITRLQALPYVLQAKSAKKAGMAGATIILTDMQYRIPVKTGYALSKLMIKDDSGTGNEVRMLIGPDKKAAWRLRFIEFGVKPHEILAKHSRVMVDRNGIVYGTRVHHPGFAEKPFMRPALDEKGPAAVAAIWEVLATTLDEENAVV